MKLKETFTRLFISSFITGLFICCNTQAQSGANPFGVLPNAVGSNQNLDINAKIKVAKSLGVSYIRTLTIMQEWNGRIPDYNAYTNAGLKVLLNVNYARSRQNGQQAPAPYPTDMNAYKQTLSSILDKYRPEVVVIENEENNIGYHSGTAQEYLQELSAAIDVCHAKGLKVTNGGLTPIPVKLMVYQDYKDRGMNAEARDFAQRALNPELMGRLKPGMQKQLDLAKEELEGYKSLNLDYVNFHWYEPTKFGGGGSMQEKAMAVQSVNDVDTKALGETVDFLKRATGKTIITNEIGELNQSPTVVTSMLNKLAELGLPYVIWYSGDGGTGKAVALNEADGSLRENGNSFRDFVTQHFGSGR